MRSTLLCFGALLTACASASGPGPTAPPLPRTDAAPTLTNPVEGQRPRYDRRGSRLVVTTGAPGARQLRIVDLASGAEETFGGPGDNRDPTWTPDDKIVFASNRDGDFDLWRLDPRTQVTEQLTDLPGDELEPTVAPIPFGFYAVRRGICGSPAEGRLLDAYQKVLFTRRNGDASEIWFSSVRPCELPSTARPRQGQIPELSPHGTHQGRLSAPGRSCSAPSFALDGLSVVFSCDGAIEDAPAKYTQSFEAAIREIRGPAAPECHGWDVNFEQCLPKLERRYAEYPGQPVSEASAALERPSISANQTVLLADANGQTMQRPRFEANAPWEPLPLGVPAGTHLVWSPTGREVAFETQAGVRRAQTHYYLQTVRNLHAFPELFGAGESSLLRKNHFVMRPADHKEFYVLHDQLRYARRPQFISTDVALQAFRDEFLRLLRKAEQQAAESVRALTGALMQHYVDRLGKTASPLDRYYAGLFATAWVPLEAAHQLPQVSDEERFEAQVVDDPELAARVAELSRPAIERLPEQLLRLWPRLPASIRDEVRGNVERMLRHAGIEPMIVPGQEPLLVDFSQFAVRGAYAENDLGGYFLAMNWLGAMPLPLDPSLREIDHALHQIQLGKRTAYETWQRVDTVVGSFMGRPVDATPRHVTEELRKLPSFDRAALEARLLARRGPVPIRDASGKERPLMVTLFPKRVGLDVTFFRVLTHPDVPGRGMPTSLDVFAALGNARARKHALAAEQLEEKYRQVLDALTRKTAAQHPGYASTDLYHSWLAALVTLATPIDLPKDTTLRFARNTAYEDRQLFSALAGYAQLKHSAVLYAMQDVSAECDGETSYHVALEEPLLPRPRGFVEPNVPFYEALAALARESYQRLSDDPRGPNVDQYVGQDEPYLNAMTFVTDLTDIARAELAGRPLTDDQVGFIEFVGGRLEPLTLGLTSSATVSIGGDQRAERGVALITDIHTNSFRRQVVAIGIGRIFDLWVVVPAEVGESLTQGGALSFYELTAPMAQRPTDAAWAAQLDAGQVPPLPPWTNSFLEIPAGK